jgi:coenzyme F420 biosynthesis associated uncharacterized protein
VTSPGRARNRLLGRIAGTYPLAETYHLAALRSDMARITGEVTAVVEEATALSLPGSPTTAVIGRDEWIERNIASFTHMLEPARRQLEDRLAESSGGTGAVTLVNILMQAEVRALLGVLSRRVLGQYELVLPTGETGDSVAYVGPNLLQLERIHQFRPSEFRYWVALHEMTHRAQFQGIPWMRGYFLGLVEDLVEHSKPEPGRLGRVVAELRSRREVGADLVDERGLFGLFASPAQSAVVDKVQALMSLLEGHGHVVMDRVGAERLKSQPRMSRILKNRRTDRRTAAFFRLTGMEMKLRQYQQGERFVLAVEREAGWETVSLAFTDAGHLPTLDEIEEPSKWTARVA